MKSAREYMKQIQEEVDMRVEVQTKSGLPIPEVFITVQTLLDLNKGLEIYSCYSCQWGMRGACEWAWDDYNTGGDCLAEK